MRRLSDWVLEMWYRLTDYFREIALSFRVQEPQPYEAAEAQTAEAEYTDEALRALEEWHVAENYFNSINDPDLVEYALYELEAARRKYEYLMRKLRKGDAAWERGRRLHTAPNAGRRMV